MQCPKCGWNINPVTNKCSICGTVATDSISQPQVQTTINNNPNMFGSITNNSNPNMFGSVTTNSNPNTFSNISNSVNTVTDAFNSSVMDATNNMINNETTNVDSVSTTPEVQNNVTTNSNPNTFSSSDSFKKKSNDPLAQAKDFFERKFQTKINMQEYGMLKSFVSRGATVNEIKTALDRANSSNTLEGNKRVMLMIRVNGELTRIKTTGENCEDYVDTYPEFVKEQTTVVSDDPLINIKNHIETKYDRPILLMENSKTILWLSEGYTQEEIISAIDQTYDPNMNGLSINKIEAILHSIKK